MSNEDYASYELALKLKACGFCEPCDHYYTKEDAPEGTAWIVPTIDREDFNADSDCPFCKPLCSAPNLWQAQKWLREKGIAVSVQANEIQGELWYSADIITTKGINELVDGGFDYMEYEAALSAGIAAAIELIE
jgi:hypothetical protein